MIAGFVDAHDFILWTEGAHRICGEAKPSNFYFDTTGESAKSILNGLACIVDNGSAYSSEMVVNVIMFQH